MESAATVRIQRHGRARRLRWVCAVLHLVAGSVAILLGANDALLLLALGLPFLGFLTAGVWSSSRPRATRVRLWAHALEIDEVRVPLETARAVFVGEEDVEIVDAHGDSVAVQLPRESPLASALREYAPRAEVELADAPAKIAAVVASFLLLGVIAAIGGSILGPLGGAISCAILLVSYASAQTFGTTRVVLGIDGLHLRQRLHERFVAWRDIREVQEAGESVLLRLADDSGLFIHAWAAQAGIRSSRRTALTREIARRADRGRAIEPLRRGERTLLDWHGAMRRLAADGYRESSLTAEELLHVLFAFCSSVEERVGAAMAVAPEHRRAVLQAADRCADADLARALRGIADGVLDELVLARVVG